MTVRVEGLEKIKDKLEEFPGKVERSILRKGMRTGCKLWKTAAIAEAPVRSGLTASKIKVRSGGSKSGVTRMSVGVGEKDFAGVAFYAAFVLYGHKVGRRQLGDSRKAVPANNWLKRAFDAVKNEVADTTIEAWWELIKDEME